MSGDDLSVVLGLGETCDPADLLVRWTRKEAVLKAVGLGLSTSPADVVIAEDPTGPRVTSFAAWPDPSRWRLYGLTGPPSMVGSLATWGSEPTSIREGWLDLTASL